MQFAPNSHDNGARLSGLGFVIVLHLVMIWALADGLIKRGSPKPPPQTDVVVVEKPVEPPPPDRPVVKPDVQPPAVPREIWVPPTEFDVRVQVDTAPTASHEPRDTSPSLPAAPSGRGAEPAVPATPTVQSAGMLCPTRGIPELPPVGVEGLASFRVLGTVRDGRVVAVEVTALRSLGDRRAMRALVQSLERTVRETYQCGQSNGQFAQDFDFRIN